MVDQPLSPSTSQALFCVLFISNRMQLGLQRLTSLRRFTISFKNYREGLLHASLTSFYIYNPLSRTLDRRGFQRLSSLQSLHLAEVPWASMLARWSAAGYSFRVWNRELSLACTKVSEGEWRILAQDCSRPSDRVTGVDLVALSLCLPTSCAVSVSAFKLSFL